LTGEYKSVRLEKPLCDDTFNLIMSPVEWPEILALAKFAQAGIAYDAQAAYVRQVFTYLMLQPADLLKDADTQAAFAAVERVGVAVGGGEVIVRLGKAQMRQLLVMLGMAAESEDQAELVHGVEAEDFPHQFPDLGPSSQSYAQVFDELLQALYDGLSVNVRRPPSYRD
jgi:hypothetical protein